MGDPATCNARNKLCIKMHSPKPRKQGARVAQAHAQRVWVAGALEWESKSMLKRKWTRKCKCEWK